MLNKIQLIGNIGSDIELTSTTTGKSVCKFSVATGTKDNTTWHRVELWEKNADNASKWLKKGNKVYIEGEQKNDKVGDKYFSKVQGYKFLNLTPRTENQTRIDENDEVPFWLM